MLAHGQCPDTPPSAAFKKESLTTSGQLKEPIEMSVAKDGRVFIAQRDGNILLYDPATHGITVVVKLDVYLYAGQFDVGGILGVAVNTAFPTDNWVYVYYAPRGLWNGKAVQETGRLTQRLARFRFAGGKIDTNTQQVLFDIPATWQTHNGGSLKFGKDGDLYLSTGDNSCAGCNDQFSPMDERPGKEYTDDQRSTTNTNDLRGKILRIHPEASQVSGRWYSIPKGNLFPEGTAKTLPEIFTMGHRNPYRIFPDYVTGRLYIGEFGPAAHNATERGPEGADQIKVTDNATFLGYPYFLKDNQPYCHWDYAQLKCVPIKGQTGMKYDPLRPVNTSPNNTGLEVLPPASPAALWEHDGSSPDPIPGIKACGFGAGAVYHYDAGLASTVKFPPWFESKLLIFGIGGGWQPKLAIVPPGPVAPLKSAVAAPWTAGGINFSAGVHDMEYGMGDGALYVLDYGGAFYNNNGDAGLFRITYNGCLPPVGTALRSRKAGDGTETGRTGFVVLADAGMRPIQVPAGARGVEAWTLSGRKVWENWFLADAEATLTLPASLRTGLVRLKWKGL
jgi:cytochrome c